MIKLEKLKKGEVVHYICDHYWHDTLIITREFYKEYKNYTVNGKFKNNKRMKHLNRYDESSLFRTRKEADDEMKILRKERKEYLNNKNNLLKLLSTNGSFLADEDRKIINELLKE